MKEFICKKDYYVEGSKFASKGDYVVLLQDNRTVVNNTNGNQKVAIYPDIINDAEYFAFTYETLNHEPTIEDEMVNSPSHYTWLKDRCGVEVIDIVRHMDFNLGNALKYILRAGHKQEEGYTTDEKAIQDLEKAIWYIKDKIKCLENEI